MPLELQDFWNLRWRECTTQGRPWQGVNPDSDLMNHVLSHRNSIRSVLEIGCGVGVNSMWMAQLGINVIGVDVSDVAISLAKKLAYQQSGPSPTFVQADMLDTELCLDRFDLVVDIGCLVVLNHEHDRSLLVHNVAKHLVDDGCYWLKTDCTELTPQETGFCRRSLAQVVTAVEPHLRIESVTTSQIQGADSSFAAWLLQARSRTIPARPWHSKSIDRIG